MVRVARGIGLLLGLLGMPAVARSQGRLPPLPPPAPPPSAAAPVQDDSAALPPLPPSSPVIILAPPPAPPPAPSVAPSARTKAPPLPTSSFGVARTLARSVPMAATLDGSWSIALHVLTELVNRTWDAPYPWGTIGQYSTRILYGGSWTLMLGLESMIYLAASGGKLDGIAEARFRSDWVVSYDLPACPTPGAFGGCGVGVGGYSFIGIRPYGTRWWFEAGGGWVQQRVLNDENRTVGESTWVLSPLTATYEARTGPGPAELRVRGGPGVFFGAHNAHVHPTLRGRRGGIDPPWHAMYPLDAGIGPGARAEVELVLWEHLSLDAELVVAPLLLGGPTTRREPEIAPLDFAREGISTWRRGTAALGWVTSRAFPLKSSIAVTSTELSERPIVRAGNTALLLRFDIPLDVERARNAR